MRHRRPWLLAACLAFALTQPVRAEAPGVREKNLPETEVRRLPATGGAWCRSVAFSPDGKTVAGGYLLKVFLWDVATGREVFAFPGGEVPIDAVAFSPDGKILAAAGGGIAHASARPIYLLDAATGKELRRVGQPGAQTTLFAFSPDSATVLVAGRYFIETWDVATGKRRTQLNLTTRTAFLTARFSPDGKLLAGYGDTAHLPDYVEDTLGLWDVKTGKELRRVGRPKARTKVESFPAFSADGKTVAVLLADGTLRLWDVKTGKELRRIGEPIKNGEKFEVKNHGLLTFTSDGKVLAGANLSSPEHGVSLWDVATGKELRRFERRHDRFTASAFSPDGRLIALATGEAVYLYGTGVGLETSGKPKPFDGVGETSEIRRKEQAKPK